VATALALRVRQSVRDWVEDRYLVRGARRRHELHVLQHPLKCRAAADDVAGCQPDLHLFA
jgi:hypothetical protein